MRATVLGSPLVPSVAGPKALPPPGSSQQRFES